MKTTTKKTSLFAGGIFLIALSLLTLSVGSSTSAYAASQSVRGPQALPTVPDVTATPIPASPTAPSIDLPLHQARLGLPIRMC